MGSLIDNLGTLKRSTIERNSRRSQQWFINKIKKGEIDRKYLTSKPQVGKMYTYSYDPKHKATLPYYDVNPLVIPIDYYTDGFLGLNLHYLPPKLRLLLLDKLMDYKVGNGPRARMKLSYQLLSSTSRLKAFRPTIHRYLYSHLRTKFALIPEDEWEFAVTLPLARFIKAKNPEVYKISRGMY